jgi:putative endonuclease
MGNERVRLGAMGEDLAANWYQSAGYRLLDRNWRSRSGEIDLVLGRGDVVVFCEVKTRSTARFGTPVEAVTWAKQARLRRLAGQWLSASALRPTSVRFDIAAVHRGRVEIVENAF